MSGVEDLIINDQYLVLVAISILFTILTIFRRTVLLEVITWVCWFVVAASHLLASPSTTPFYSLSILYWGLGLIFFVLMWYDIFQLFAEQKKNRGFGPI